MAYDLPLPDIERARQIIDALGAMVAGEPCPACMGEGGRDRFAAPGTNIRRFTDCRICAGLGVLGGVTQAQGEAIAALFEGDRALFELLDERPGHWALGSGPERYTDSCGREWHWKLRQARNTRERFFDRLEDDARSRAPRSAEGSR